MDINDREDFDSLSKKTLKIFFVEAMSSEAVSAEIAGRVSKNTTHTITWAHRRQMASLGLKGLTY